MLEAILLAKPQMRTGETVLEAIARVRGELAAAHCELMQLRGAPLPLDDLKEMATEALSRLPRHHCRCRAGSSTSPGQGPVAFLAWVNAEQVIARLHRQIDRLPAPANALSAAERNRRTTEINTKQFPLSSSVGPTLLNPALSIA